MLLNYQVKIRLYTQNNRLIFCMLYDIFIQNIFFSNIMYNVLLRTILGSLANIKRHCCTDDDDLPIRPSMYRDKRFKLTEHKILTGRSRDSGPHLSIRSSVRPFVRSSVCSFMLLSGCHHQFCTLASVITLSLLFITRHDR